MNSTVVVTGANSGIGNAFAKLLVNEGYKVLAADITIGEPIKSLGCETFELDVASQSSIDAFKQKIGDQRVDILLNIAGVMSSPEEDDLQHVNEKVLQRTFTINTLGPLLLTQSLLPNLTKAPHPRLAVMSSRMGSIADNSSGGSYAYRGSKAAVNAFFKSLAVDLKDKNVVVTLLHPGIVKTNLYLGNAEIKDAVEPKEAAMKLWGVLMGKGMEDTGKWFHRDGFELPW